jgi:phospholipase C
MDATTSPQRRVGSLPSPDPPAGTANPDVPIEHVVVVMMENHSFDNLLGALPVNGQPAADGLTFVGGRAQNSNPGPIGADGVAQRVDAFPLATTEQESHVSQSWNATRAQIDGGAMAGFVRQAGSPQPMGYYTPELLPFSYWLAAVLVVDVDKQRARPGW